MAKRNSVVRRQPILRNALTGRFVSVRFANKHPTIIRKEAFIKRISASVHTEARGKGKGKGKGGSGDLGAGRKNR